MDGSDLGDITGELLLRGIFTLTHLYLSMSATEIDEYEFVKVIQLLKNTKTLKVNISTSDTCTPRLLVNFCAPILHYN